MHLVFRTTSVICFRHLNSRKVAGVAKPGCESALHSTWALALSHMLHVYICQMFFFGPHDPNRRVDIPCHRPCRVGYEDQRFRPKRDDDDW